MNTPPVPDVRSFRPGRWAAALTAAAWLALILDLPAVFRAPSGLAFGLFAPGLGIVSLLGLRRPLVEVMLAIGTSIATLTLVSYGMVKWDGWSTNWGLVWLSVVALTGMIPEFTARAARPALTRQS
jgi:hypothetical protein